MSFILPGTEKDGLGTLGNNPQPKQESKQDNIAPPIAMVL